MFLEQTNKIKNQQSFIHQITTWVIFFQTISLVFLVTINLMSYPNFHPIFKTLKSPHSEIDRSVIARKPLNVVKINRQTDTTTTMNKLYGLQYIWADKVIPTGITKEQYCLFSLRLFYWGLSPSLSIVRKSLVNC